MKHIQDEIKGCYGCTACEDVCPVQAIKMVANAKGFLIPRVDESKCVDCGKCTKVCQVNGVNELSHRYLHIYGIKNADRKQVKRSASGGAFSLISDFVLSAGGYVCGAVFQDNFRVTHILGSSKDERNLMCGSKYVQSDVRGIYRKTKQLLDNGEMVLFSGTPCQVSGLQKYLGKSYANLVTCSLICHGVTSPMIYSDFIRDLKVSYPHLQEINFRNKDFGWNNQVWTCTNEGNVISASKKLNNYKTLYYSSMALRESCYTCPYSSMTRPGDFTIGDYWGVDKSNPEFFDECGVSLVMTHTEKANTIIQKIIDDGLASAIEVNEEQCAQPNLIAPTEKSSRCNEFWEYYFRHGYGKTIKHFYITPLWKRAIRKAMRIIKRE